MVTISRKELMNKLGAFVSVRNCDSRNGMNTAPNQFELNFKNGRVLQSYNSLIAVYYCGKLYLTDHHDYSVTTSRFCKQFTGLDVNERRKGLECGEIVFIAD